jgi:hypothetical protein
MSVYVTADGLTPQISADNHVCLNRLSRELRINRNERCSEQNEARKNGSGRLHSSKFLYAIL